MKKLMKKGKLMSIERKPLNSLCATLCYALGIEPPKQANEKNPFLAEYIDSSFLGKKVDRLVMYNPDAVAEWIFRKYPYLLEGVLNANGFELPLESPMPSVTPVCFGTMYTGAEPSVHGIEKYERKLITIDTFFDALVIAGKKVAICSQSNCSMSIIYLEREIDYFIYPTVEEINAAIAGDMDARKAAKKIGFVEKVEIDANEARREAQAKTTVKESAERTN
jgi:hypothetical protein